MGQLEFEGPERGGWVGGGVWLGDGSLAPPTNGFAPHNNLVSPAALPTLRGKQQPGEEVTGLRSLDRLLRLGWEPGGRSPRGGPF